MVFDGIYAGVETRDNNVAVLYSNVGVPSVIFEIENPVTQMCTDGEMYGWYLDILRNVIDTIGEGYALQKQDIFCRQKYHREVGEDAGFLTRSYFKYFDGREYTEIRTYLIISQEAQKGMFVSYDAKKDSEFLEKIEKIGNVLRERGVDYRLLNAKQIDEYCHRFMAFDFRHGTFAMQNIRANDDGLYFGDGRTVKSFQLVDIGCIDLPSYISPYQEVTVNGYPVAVDLLSFLSEIPFADCVVYNQVIQIPYQREKQQKLIGKQKRHASMPDPSNRIAQADIQQVLDYLSVNTDLLVNSNFNILVSCPKKLVTKVASFIETKLYTVGITPSKSACNQLELFSCSFPGMSYSFNPEYDLFLTLAGPALCLFYKERLKCSENTPLKNFYTDRQGLPVCIDITGKEGSRKMTDNANFFCIGPSGSGKSFHMNSLVRQLIEQDTEVVMVDTGNSYEGLNHYFQGTYIAYSKERPISMNPFKMTRMEYDGNFGEKKNFLKSLVFLIFKGNELPTKLEDTIIDQVLVEYYEAFFDKFDHFPEEARQAILSTRMMNARRTGEYRAFVDSWMADHKDEVLNNEDFGEQARRAFEAKVQLDIDDIEAERRKMKVESLSFNTFYEFAIERISQILAEDKVEFDIFTFAKVLKQFYRGGALEYTLNNDLDIDLFNERFIVFEIDQIKDDPVLFPIVVLIIMDVFLQKMRLKKGRKAIIIEEAWKAIASPSMAEYIKFLYKTVRKFNGIAGVVTQELNDVIESPIVREAIINNSDIKILLDQAKFKDRYDDISRILGLTQVQKQQIFTINALNNKEGRSYFKEVWICRGQVSDVFGVEEPPECYWAYTTERVEKEALKIYQAAYPTIQDAIAHIEADRKASGMTRNYLDFARLVNRNGKIMELWEK